MRRRILASLALQASPYLRLIDDADSLGRKDNMIHLVSEPTAVEFADFGDALRFACTALGERLTASDLRPGDRRTRRLMETRVETSRRLGWSWSFVASPDDDAVAVSVRVPPVPPVVSAGPPEQLLAA